MGLRAPGTILYFQGSRRTSRNIHVKVSELYLTISRWIGNKQFHFYLPFHEMVVPFQLPFHEIVVQIHGLIKSELASC